jgi:DNA-binding response OmpR family regulator
MHILLVEDEPLIANFVARGLSAEGYTPAVASNGEEAWEQLRRREWDMVVLDLRLPGRDGLDLLREITAAKPGLPVLVLSALTTVESKVAAFEAGAVDFLGKPFAFDELLARLRARLRDPVAIRPAEAATPALDTRNRRLRLRDGRSVQLSARECELLAYMLRTPDEVVSRERILNAVWRYQFDPRSNVVDVYVARLRRKLESDFSIETVRGGGYRLSAV